MRLAMTGLSALGVDLCGDLYVDMCVDLCALNAGWVRQVRAACGHGSEREMRHVFTDRNRTGQSVACLLFCFSVGSRKLVSGGARDRRSWGICHCR